MINATILNASINIEKTQMGGRLDIADAESGIVISLPIPQQNLEQMAEGFILLLTDEQRKNLLPKLTGGIVLPSSGFRPPRNGPQG